MTEEQYKHIEDTLRNLSLYIYNCKDQERRSNPKKFLSYIKQTNLPGQEDFEVLQLNKLKDVKGVFQFFNKKEIDKMPKLKDLSYRYRSDGIHEFRYRKNGIYRSFCSVKLDQARKKAMEFCKELNSMIGLTAQGLKPKTMDDVAEAYFTTRRQHSEKSTYRVYEGVYKNHVKEIFGKRTLKTIIPMELQPFFDNLYLKSGRICENVKIVINGIFEYAIANRICTVNPLKAVIIEQHVREPGKALEGEELKKFIQTMKENKSPFGIALLIILYSGIRGAELESMTFNWKDGTFSVNNAKLKKSQKRNPANLIRTVPIFPGLYKLKDKIESQNWKIKASTLTSKFRLHWKGNSTIKDLRHTFSTKARESGIENELVNIWMGHAPGTNLTANTYTHFSMEYQQKEAKKLDNY